MSPHYGSMSFRRYRLCVIMVASRVSLSHSVFPHQTGTFLSRGGCICFTPPCIVLESFKENGSVDKEVSSFRLSDGN